ncbi:hypothetical protein, partial [Actinoplanes campanulatus]|uniref:hypothetical protein n=1 Tax=Actinoplanes campanulatus TaxID=113559 RepID=UPI0019539437
SQGEFACPQVPRPPFRVNVIISGQISRVWGFGPDVVWGRGCRPIISGTVFPCPMPMISITV